jgi:hypothetical protein
MTVLMKIKKISLGKCTLSCHKLSKLAYQLSKDLKHQIPSENLHTDFIQMSQSLEPLHVIQLSLNRFEFFAGWHWFDLCLSRDIGEAIIIIHQSVTSEKLKNFAWTYQLSTWAVDLHRKTNLAQISAFVDQVPLDVRKLLFERHHSYSALTTVSSLTNETRSAIRNQLGKPTKNITQTSSILKDLLRGS